MATRKARYQWYEAANGYYVIDTKTDTTRGMGDGVDLVFVNGRSVKPGTAKFNRSMDQYFRKSQSEIGEAFFGR